MNKLKKGCVWLLLCISTIAFLYPDMMQIKLRLEAESGIEKDQDVYENMTSYNHRLQMEEQNLTDCWYKGGSSVSVDVEGTETSETEQSIQVPDGVIGQIRIPVMEVDLPIYYGASNENLAKGAAVLNETSMPVGGENTNCVIAGHRGYSGMMFFRKIDELEVGDVVEIINSQETLEYIVERMEIIVPTDLTCLEIQKGRDMVTLISCHPYRGGSKFRYVVYCHRSGTPSLEELGNKTMESVVLSSSIRENKEIQKELQAEEKNIPLTFQWEDQIRYVLYVAFALVWIFLIIDTIKRGRQKNKQ